MRTRATAASFLIVLVTTAGGAVVQSPPALGTRWAADVTADRVLPEYPRPELVRRDWRNLNGPWEYAIRDREADRPVTFDGAILVPFPVQSRLSGVARPVSDHERVWYRRTLRADPVVIGNSVRRVVSGDSCPQPAIVIRAWALC